MFRWFKPCFRVTCWNVASNDYFSIFFFNIDFMIDSKFLFNIRYTSLYNQNQNIKNHNIILVLLFFRLIFSMPKNMIHWFSFLALFNPHTIRWDLIDGKKQLCQSCKCTWEAFVLQTRRTCIFNVKRNVCALFATTIDFCLMISKYPSLQTF